jgi:hypothetical protein
LNVIEGVPEVLREKASGETLCWPRQRIKTYSDDHLRMLNTIHKPRCRRSRRMDVGTMNQVDIAGDQFNETVDVFWRYLEAVMATSEA